MIVDLRSDTVTKPTQEMLQAMAVAELGDNVLERDPTVQQLEELSAEMTGMEDALFVPSGTMGNQVAIATHTRPGDSILAEADSHVVWYEGGSPAVIAGVLVRSVPTKTGVMTVEEMRAHLFARSHHTPGTTLVCVENTHNRFGGAVVPLESLASYRTLGLPIHMDGARVFNAAVALGVPVSEITKHVDTVTFCLSKGLSAPVGSVLCGPKAFIEEAAYWRKRLGGGLRQAGILAACGIVGLRSLVDRLAEDHDRARRLAAHCATLPGVRPLPCPTNILVMGTDMPAPEWQSRLEAKGVRTIPFDQHRLRAVLHREIDDASLARACEAFSEVAAEGDTLKA